MKHFLSKFTHRLTVYQKPGFVGIAKENTPKISQKSEKPLLEIELLVISLKKTLAFLYTINLSKIIHN